MTDMAGDQNLFCRPAWKQILAIGQITFRERCFNANFVFFVLECFELAMGKAKTPILVVIRRAVWYPIGTIRQREEVLLQLLQPHPPSNRSAVADYVEVGLPEVDDSSPPGILDVRILDVPLSWDGPVENLRPRGNLMDFQGDMASHYSQDRKSTRLNSSHGYIPYA